MKTLYNFAQISVIFSIIQTLKVAQDLQKFGVKIKSPSN